MDRSEIRILFPLELQFLKKLTFDPAAVLKAFSFEESKLGLGVIEVVLMVGSVCRTAFKPIFERFQRGALGSGVSVFYFFLEPALCNPWCIQFLGLSFWIFILYCLGLKSWELKQLLVSPEILTKTTKLPTKNRSLWILSNFQNTKTGPAFVSQHGIKPTVLGRFSFTSGCL